MPWSTFLRNQDDSTMDLTELAVAMGSKWGPQAIACGGPSMVSVYNLPEQMRHNGAREPIYRHGSV